MREQRIWAGAGCLLCSLGVVLIGYSRVVFLAQPWLEGHILAGIAGAMALLAVVMLIRGIRTPAGEQSRPLTGWRMALVLILGLFAVANFVLLFFFLLFYVVASLVT